MRDKLLRTAFLTAVGTYIGFAGIEYLEPGFVSTVFSLHIVAAIALVLGIAWAHTARRAVTPKHWYLVLHALGIALAVLVWREGQVFAEWRLFLSLAAALLPALVLKALSVRHE